MQRHFQLLLRTSHGHHSSRAAAAQATYSSSSSSTTASCINTKPAVAMQKLAPRSSSSRTSVTAAHYSTAAAAATASKLSFTRSFNRAAFPPGMHCLEQQKQQQQRQQQQQHGASAFLSSATTPGNILCHKNKLAWPHNNNPQQRELPHVVSLSLHAHALSSAHNHHLSNASSSCNSNSSSKGSDSTAHDSNTFTSGRPGSITGIRTDSSSSSSSSSSGLPSSCRRVLTLGAASAFVTAGVLPWSFTNKPGAAAAASVGSSSGGRAAMSTTAAAAGGGEAGTTSDTGVLVVYVTAPSAEVAGSIAEQLVNGKLAACVNILPGITSIYTWKGKVEKDSEVLMIIKTQATLLTQLTAKVKELHPYDEPEVVGLPVVGGSSSYLQWVRDSTTHS